jgi:transcriptional regulator with XRE-family HTH domain
MTEIQFREALGQRIKRLRRQADLTQIALADRCGIYRTYLGQIEAGTANPTLNVMLVLANSLDMQLSDLLADIHE